MTTANRIVTVLCLALVGACASPLGAVDDVDDVDDLGLEVTSGVPELRARVDGLTVWMDGTAHAETRDGRRVWVLEGRASKDLKEVFSFVPDDAYGATRVTSARKFEVVLDDASEINTMLSGLPLYVRVTPKTGEPAFAGVWMAPRLARVSGSSRLHVQEAIAPVWVAGELVYRARVTASAPYAALVVATTAAPSDRAAPAIVAEATRQWKLDWVFDRMIHVAGGTVTFTGTSATGTTVSKRAGLDFAVSQLALTRADPYAVWESTCEPAVQACLAVLPAGELDTEACGTYRQVLLCGGVALPGGE